MTGARGTDAADAEASGRGEWRGKRSGDGTACRYRSETSGNPGLSADQGGTALRPRGAGADQRGGRAGLSDPRRHSDHAGRRGPAAAPGGEGRREGPAAPAAALGRVDMSETGPWPVELRLR